MVRLYHRQELQVYNKSIKHFVKHCGIKSISVESEDDGAYYGLHAFIFDLTSICFDMIDLFGAELDEHVNDIVNVLEELEELALKELTASSG